MIILSENIQRIEVEQCTNVDELKRRINRFDNFSDIDIQMSLQGAFSYAEKFMGRKLQRHTVQVQVYIPRGEFSTFFMRFGQTQLEYITSKDGERLEIIKDYIPQGNKIQFRPSNDDRTLTIQYSCGYSVLRGPNKIPDDIVIAILMRGGAMFQVKTDVTSEALKRAVICSDDLFKQYRLRV